MAKALRIGELLPLLSIAFNQFSRDDPPLEHPIEQIKEFLSGEGSLPELFEELKERPEAPEFSPEAIEAAREQAESAPSFTASLPMRDVVAEINEEGRKEEAALFAANPDSFNLSSRRMVDDAMKEFRSWTRNGILDASRINTRPVDSHR